MKILVIGGGGREHALVWKIKKSPRVRELFCVPGNAGIAQEAVCISIKPNETERLLAFAKEKKIDLTVVGPEQPLATGIVDAFQAAGLKIFGPSRGAAQIEASKVYAKRLMERCGVPTARFCTVNSKADAMKAYEDQGLPIVIKADGLAGGKGVFIAQTHQEAVQAVNFLMERRGLGTAGETVVLEEYLKGTEATFMVFTDGKTASPMVPSRDHKAVYDGDLGPNTGGMGAYAPAAVITPSLQEEVMESVVNPLLSEMTKSGTPYRGVLYVGLMICDGKPKVLEFNSRFGDPEAQAVLPLLQTDLIEVMEAAINGTLHRVSIQWERSAALCVVLTSKGYPGDYQTGIPIHGLKRVRSEEGLLLFHSGTGISSAPDHPIVTQGGRVLGVTGLGPTLKIARERAYSAVSHIRFDGMHYRKDIGFAELMPLPERQAGEADRG
jgi:phosphoribosylamine---glycine ligase